MAAGETVLAVPWHLSSEFCRNSQWSLEEWWSWELSSVLMGEQVRLYRSSSFERVARPEQRDFCSQLGWMGVLPGTTV